MHELAITKSLFDLVVERAKREKARKVTAINIVVGSMTGVVAESLQTYFQIISKGSIAEGARLETKMVPAQLRCRSCNKTASLMQPEYICPSCNGNDLEISAGRELFVVSIEIEGGPDAPPGERGNEGQC